MIITKEVKEYLSYQKKLVILKTIQKHGSVRKTLKDFNIPRSTYYKWKRAFNLGGELALQRKHPVASSHPNRIKPEVVDQVLRLRKEQQLGSWRIKWYLERYHDIRISESSVTRILKRMGVPRPEKKVSRPKGVLTASEL